MQTTRPEHKKLSFWAKKVKVFAKMTSSYWKKTLFSKKALKMIVKIVKKRAKFGGGSRKSGFPGKVKKVQNLQISGFRKTPENDPPKKGLFLGLPNWQEFHFLGVFLKIKPIFRDKKSTKRIVLTPQKGGPPPWGGPPTPTPGGRGVGVPHPSPPGGPPPGGGAPPPPGGVGGGG